MTLIDRRMGWIGCVLTVAATLAAPGALAQHDHGHGGHGEHGASQHGTGHGDDHKGHADHAPAAIDAETQQEIDRLAARLTAKLGTPELARAAGFRPLAGKVPHSGEHWVQPDWVVDGRMDLDEPETVMFAPVSGQTRLVGIAYIVPQDRDDPLPDGFPGGADRWHRHGTNEGALQGVQNLLRMNGMSARIEGDVVSMVHTWFVPASQGPFSDRNLWLPFMGLNMPWPSEALMARQDVWEPLLGAGFALGELYGSRLDEIIVQPTTVDALKRRDSHRAEISRLKMTLEQALSAGQDDAVLAALKALSAEGAAIRSINIEHAPDAASKARNQAIYGRAATLMIHDEH